MERINILTERGWELYLLIETMVHKQRYDRGYVKALVMQLGDEIVLVRNPLRRKRLFGWLRKKPEVVSSEK